MKDFVLICASLALLNCGSQQQQSDHNSDLPEPLVHPVQTVKAKESTIADSQNPSPSRPEAENRIQQSGPRITFDKVRYNFGNIYHADKVNHEFKFTNSGDRDLHITGARASCGCTTPTFPTSPIKPGDTGIIGVKYNSVGKQGSQKATIRVATNDPDQPEVVLYLSGRVLVKPKADKG